MTAHYRQQWQPIETAPKDGRHVILYCDYYGVGRCAWESWRGVWRSDDPNHGIGFPQPTHWMPLPDFPTGSVRAENARRAALAANPGAVMRENRHPHWRVSVETSGELIVAIEPEMLAGREISEADEDAIRTAAHHLLAFIGDPAPQSRAEAFSNAD